MYVIYALVDPRDNTVHYVGITDDVYQRFLQHINCSSANFDKNAWIMELRTANKMVIMETLEEVENLEQASIRETYWIRHFEMMKEPIVNISKTSSPRRSKRTNLRTGRAPSFTSAPSLDLQKVLAVYQTGMSQRQLARLLEVSHPTAGKYIQRLKDRGMIS